MNYKCLMWNFIGFYLWKLVSSERLEWNGFPHTKNRTSEKNIKNTKYKLPKVFFFLIWWIIWLLLMYGDIKLLTQKSFLIFLKNIEVISRIEAIWYSKSLVIGLVCFMHINVHKIETLPKTSLKHFSDLTF